MLRFSLGVLHFGGCAVVRANVLALRRHYLSCRIHSQINHSRLTTNLSSAERNGLLRSRDQTATDSILGCNTLPSLLRRKPRCRRKASRQILLLLDLFLRRLEHCSMTSTIVLAPRLLSIFLCPSKRHQFLRPNVRRLPSLALQTGSRACPCQSILCPLSHRTQMQASG